MQAQKKNKMENVSNFYFDTLYIGSPVFIHHIDTTKKVDSVHTIYAVVADNKGMVHKLNNISFCRTYYLRPAEGFFIARKEDEEYFLDGIKVDVIFYLDKYGIHFVIN